MFLLTWTPTASRTTLRPSKRLWLTIGDVCAGTRRNPQWNVRDTSEEDEDCSLQGRITPDAAFVSINRGSVGIDDACASCHGKKNNGCARWEDMDRFIKGSLCQRHPCLEKAWMDSKFCKKHLKSNPLGGPEQPHMFYVVLDRPWRPK